MDDVRYTLPRIIHALGLSGVYTRDWRWHDVVLIYDRNDTIIILYRPYLRNFWTIFQESLTDLVAKMYSPHSARPCDGFGGLLGFACFHKAIKYLELTNFKAQLNRPSLELRATKIDNVDETRGVALMSRVGHRVRFWASCYHWNFEFRGANNWSSYYNDSSTRLETIRFWLAHPCGVAVCLPRNLTTNILEAISKGRRGLGKWIPTADFLSWLSVTVYVNGSSNVIHTEPRDTKLEKAFLAKIDLEYPLLSLAKEFRYGYNLQHARNRQHISTQEDFAMDKYIDLLRSGISYAENNISGATMQEIWKWPKIFYYHEERSEFVWFLFLSEVSFVLTDHVS